MAEPEVAGQRIWRKLDRKRTTGIDSQLDGPPAWVDGLAEDLAEEVEYRLRRVGWFEATPEPHRRLRDPGLKPATVQRATWLIRFNPDAFDDSDPFSWFCWDDPAAAVRHAVYPDSLISARATNGVWQRAANRLREMAVGDLIFVLRAKRHRLKDRTGRIADPYGKAAHLIGLLRVAQKEVYTDADGWVVPAIRYVPMALFRTRDDGGQVRESPVEINLSRRWHPALRLDDQGRAKVPALRQPGGVHWLPPDHACAVAAACSLPFEIFTAPAEDLDEIAAGLKGMDTGPVEPMRDWQNSQQIRYEKTRRIELAAQATVAAGFENNGWVVVDVSDQRSIGFDLAVGQPWSTEVVHQVEVKGTSRPTWTAKSVTFNEKAAAKTSTDTCSGRWVLHALGGCVSNQVGDLVKYTDSEVASTFAVSDSKTMRRRPLRRLDHLPPESWGRPTR